MNPQSDTFQSRIPTLSNDELHNYITDYSRYKVEAVQLAIKELQSRGFFLSEEELQTIESFFSLKLNPPCQRLDFDPRLFRLIAYGIFIAGILISAVVYITAQPPMQNPLGYDPLDTKTYLRELELYGGISNVIASEFKAWLWRMCRGKNLSYTILCITAIISVILWRLGSGGKTCHSPKPRNPRCFQNWF